MRFAKHLALYASLLASMSAPLLADPGTAFNYQGQLQDNGVPIDGTVSLRFSLYDAATLGAQVGSTIEFLDTTADNGRVSQSLDFGAGALNGAPRWLEVQVDTDGGSDNFVTLSSRIQLLPVPYAVFAEDAADASTLDGVDSTGFATSGHTHSSLSATDATANISTSGRFVVGPTDPVLENGVSANYSAAVGGIGNSVTAQQSGVFAGASNDAGGTTRNVVVGGFNNDIIGGTDNAILGGQQNVATGVESNVVVGGFGNTVDGTHSVVVGGKNNTAEGSWSAVVGGESNTASGNRSVVVGGELSEASGLRSVAMGRRAKAATNGTFVWADNTDADFTSTDSNTFLIRASNGVGIGVDTPTEQLHVAGNARVTGAYVDSNNDPGTSGEVLSSTATGTDWVSAASLSDNLGDHTATTTLEMSSNSIANVANITMVGPGALDQSQETGDSTLSFSQENYQSFTAGASGACYSISFYPTSFSASRAGTLKLYEGTGTGGVLLATQAYDYTVGVNDWFEVPLTSPPMLDSGSVYTFSITPSSSVASIRVSATDPYPGGTGASPGFDWRFRTKIVAGVITFADGTTIQSADSLGDGVIAIDSGDEVGIGTTEASEKLHVVGNLRVTGAYVDSNNDPGASGEVLSSTATGTDWVSAASIGDDLGDHTATTTLEMSSKSIANVANITMAGPGTIDQSQETGGSFLSSSLEFYQSFTAGTNGECYSISFYPSSTTSSRTGTLKLYEGTGTGGVVLATEAYNYTVGVNDWFEVPLTSQPTLTAGSVYTFSITPSSSSAAVRVSTTNPYPGGSASLSGYDWRFRTKMVTGAITFADGTTIRSADLLGDGVIAVDSSDEVGIGTTEPSEKLHVVGNLRVTGAYADSSNDAGTSGQVLTSTATGTNWVNASTLAVTGDNLGNHTATTALNMANKAITNAAAITASDLTVDTTTLVVDEINDRVGIGTASPENPLHVLGTSNQVILAESSSGIGTWLRLENTSPGGDIWSLISTGSSNGEGSGHLLIRDGSGVRAVVDGTTGYVGIARTIPIYPVHVGTSGINGNGAHVTMGGAWTNGSSRAFKEGFEEVDAAEVLDKVAALPVTRWRYKNSAEGDHIGPVAEEFHAAFGTGDDPQYIATVDADGVALAAIKALKAQNDELKAANKDLEARLARLEQLVEGLPVAERVP